mgnify:CR=1 FL=1
MGLFENPYVSPEKAGRTVRSRAHKELARQVARKGVVLLKNEGILPLSKQLKSIAVIGPNADNMYNQLGDYTAPQERKEITTVLDGIRNTVSASTQVTYVKGCAYSSTPPPITFLLLWSRTKSGCRRIGSRRFECP